MWKLKDFTKLKLHRMLNKSKEASWNKLKATLESLGITVQEKLVEKNGKFCVAKHDTGEILKCYPNKADAIDYLQATQIAKHKEALEGSGKKEKVMEAGSYNSIDSDAFEVLEQFEKDGKQFTKITHLNWS